MSYSPEWLLSAFRMKMMVSFSVLRMLISFLSIGEPFFCHDTFALGLPCKKPRSNLCMILERKQNYLSLFPNIIWDEITLIWLKSCFFLQETENICEFWPNWTISFQFPKRKRRRNQKRQNKYFAFWKCHILCIASESSELKLQESWTLFFHCSWNWF